MIKYVKATVFFTLCLILLAVCLVSCGGEGDTTTATPVTTTPGTTTSVTPPATTLPTEDTMPDDNWQKKLEEGFFEKAVEEDGKYYAYLVIGISPESTMITEKFIQTYVADPDDVLYGYGENADDYSDILLRATQSELEAYARTPYVKFIYSYPIDKAIDSFTATRIPIVGSTDPDSLWNVAENQADKDNRAIPPIIKLESTDALNAFIAQYSEAFFLDLSKGGTSFVQHAAKYDAAFFDEKLLLLTYFEEGSGSISHNVVDLFADGKLTLFIDKISPPSQTADIACRFIFVEVNKADLEGITDWQLIIK